MPNTNTIILGIILVIIVGGVTIVEFTKYKNIEKIRDDLAILEVFAPGSPHEISESLHEIDEIVKARNAEIVAQIASAISAPPNAGGGVAVQTGTGAPGAGTDNANAPPAPAQNPPVPRGGANQGAGDSPPKIHAKWSQLVPPSRWCGSLSTAAPGGEEADGCRPNVLVRAIIDEKGDCDKLDLRRGQTRLSMQTRERPKGASIGAFPVVVCEALLEIDDEEVTFTGNETLGWKRLRELDKITVLGDTGCNKKDGQNCNDDSWLFAEIADNAARDAPELVVHVGDYRYKGADAGDDWDNWRNDFFTPAGSLLRAAPWIIARGNHESCFREQGPGWFYFLEPEYQHVSSCADDDPPRDRAPYAVDLSVLQPDDHVSALRFVVLDSTTARYDCRKWAMEFENKYAERLETLIKPADDRDTWIVTHYPIWDVSAHLLSNDPDRDKYSLCEGNYYNAQSVHRYRKLLASAIGDQASVVLSGDTHQFQVLRRHDSEEGGPSTNSNYPLQLVAGHGGTLLTPGLGAELPDGLYEDTCEREPPVRYFQREMSDGEDEPYWVFGKAVCEYGSVAAVHDSTGWSFELKPVPGAEEAERIATTCQLGESDSGPCYHDDKVSPENCVRLGSKYQDQKCLLAALQRSTKSK